MQTIKTRFGRLREFSKSLFAGRNKIVDSSKELLHHLVNQSGDQSDLEIYRELAEISRTSESNSEIADFIVVQLEDFKYETGVIKKTERLLSVAIYLLKNGSVGFSMDMKNNVEMIKGLQVLDSKHFEGSLKKKAKQLDYQIEVIKHRAKYIEKLVKDERML